jgi:hypothetical protein
MAGLGGTLDPRPASIIRSQGEKSPAAAVAGERRPDRRLMHAKFMHELCSLLTHIPIYLDVMRCYNHVALIYGDFPSILPILVITLQNRKYLFCVFLRFRTQI